MQLEIKTAGKFIEYLKVHGYPEDSIGVEYYIGKCCRADIAILEQERNIPIQLFELKINKSKRSIEAGISQLNRCRTILNDEKIPAYLIFPKNEKLYFEVLDINKIRNNNLESFDNFYENISNNSLEDKNNEFLVFNYQGQRTKRLYDVIENKK